MTLASALIGALFSVIVKLQSSRRFVAAVFFTPQTKHTPARSTLADDITRDSLVSSIFYCNINSKYSLYHHIIIKHIVLNVLVFCCSISQEG